MRILFVTSEMLPLVKTGGLADVCHGLARALGGLGMDVKVLLPAYAGVLERAGLATPVTSIDDLFGGPATLLSVRVLGIDALVLDAPHLFARAGGGPYLGADGLDWPDNARRFAALGWVGAEIARGRLLNWQPDVLHAHDWQAGLAPAYLALSGTARPASIQTIHNIAFQGLFPAGLLGELRLPASSFGIDGVEFYGQLGFLKAGLFFADHITTVSPTYAREIQTPEHGMGLHGLLRHRARELSGILNGIDDVAWNPARDPHIAAAYCAADLSGKAANKRALRSRLGLAQGASGPLFCVVSRLAHQKGLDLLLDALPGLVAADCQLAVLGTGEAGLEDAFRRAASAKPGHVACVTAFDEALSHQFQAGADAIVLPSRYEPCGLTQLFGLRYGTLPVVSRVGGLADTVIDASEAALQDGVATGFQFSPADLGTLEVALSRAVELFSERKLWTAVQGRAMTRDFGWQGPAERYAGLYRSLLCSRTSARLH